MKRPSVRRQAWLAAALLISLHACRSATAPGTDPVASSRTIASGQPDYPPAPWRTLSWPARENIVLWVSQILVSHRDATSDPFLHPAGLGAAERPSRSRVDARSLGLRVLQEAWAHPDQFEELARRYSDDEFSRSLGGSLGGVRATQLPGVFLDALTVLRRGEVSRLLETTEGFHVLLRRSPPGRESVSGRRVIIRYAGTVGGADESVTSDRSRADAKKLADEVAARAREGKVPFEELVRHYSENGDRAYDGDMGVWSTLDPRDRPREIEMLSHLKVGEVAPPLDSVWGFQVLKRVEPSSRTRYAMAAVRLKIATDVPPEDPHSPDTIYREARALARRLRATPAMLPEVQQQYECPGVETWDFGHGAPEITLALDKLRFGEIGPEPLRVPYAVVIPMRLDPALVGGTAPNLAYDLPLRSSPDLSAIFHDADPSGLTAHLDELMRPEVAMALGLTAREAATIRSILAALKRDLGATTSSDERVKSYDLAVKRLRDGMSEAGYSRFMDFVEKQAARALLGDAH